MENPAPGAADCPSSAMNDYEAQRAARIASNKQRMEELGVLQAAQQLNQQQQQKPKWRGASTQSAKDRPAPAVDSVATRASKRIKGGPQVDTSTQQDVAPYSSATASSSKGKRDPSGPRFEVTDTVYAAPFYLPSIATTVHCLGEIYRGPFSSNYWSSKGSLYRHIYPVGYHASKEAFGCTWDMKITAGEGGPVFTVSQRDGTRSYTGPSATRPWTDVCLAFRPGQRISGPLYFGFSDVHVQRALAAMYTPDELSLALYGPNPPPPQPAAVQPQQVQPGEALQQQHPAVQQVQPPQQAVYEQQLLQPQVRPQQQQQQPPQQQAQAVPRRQLLPAGPARPRSGSSSRARSTGPLEPAFELTTTHYAAPFTLAASGVTVHQLGEVYRGPDSFVIGYWSPEDSPYRHAYPVGYRASKQAWGRTWDMDITEGVGGPIFSVSQRGSELRYIGPSPFCPWSDICVGLEVDIVSGPEYFGFTDVNLQRALAAMYTPEELALALFGDPNHTALPPAAAQQQPQQDEQPVQQAQPPVQHQAQQQMEQQPEQQPQQQQQLEQQPKQQPQQQLQPKVEQQAELVPPAAEAAAPRGAPAGVASSSQACDSSGVQQQQQQEQEQQQQQQQQVDNPGACQQQLEGLSAAEAFATELQSVKGIGATTARVLALTTALGGARHTSLQSLCSWLAADPGHSQQLQDYLTDSEEVPRSSRQLPAWRQKWVPMIVQQLAELQQQQQEQQQQQ